MHFIRRRLAVLLIPIVIAGCQTAGGGAPTAAETPVQGQATAPESGTPARGPFVAAANPLAVEAGVKGARGGGGGGGGWEGRGGWGGEGTGAGSGGGGGARTRRPCS
ncbi:hypothetical protein ER13_05560 [Brevundimonas sp. EAKA]|nr:hypothetical protein ER13_05560 [Brevundimonas sp. EAKA]